jgi:hypothetical protein
MKIKESVIREKISRILKEQRKLDRSIEGFIDAFLLTDKYNFQDLGYFGEKIAEIWCKESFANSEPVLNLNQIKKQNFSFGDIVVGSLDNLSEAIIYSVKATSANVVPMSNSSVNLSSINDMFIKPGVAGLLGELQKQKIVEKQIPITLGLITVRPTGGNPRRGVSPAIKITEYSSKFLVVKKEPQLIRDADADDMQGNLFPKPEKQPKQSKLQFKLIRQSDEVVKELTGYIKSAEAASNFFGSPVITNYSLNRSEAFEEDRRFNYEDARKERTRLLGIFKDNLSSLSNEDLATMIRQAQEFAKKNANLSESFSKELIKTCLDLLIERKRS